VTVGKVASPEDAVFVDIDRDGRLDVVSCCEGRERTVFAHLAPGNPANLLDPGRWTTAGFPATLSARQWMYCLPLDLGHEERTALVLGAKGREAQLGWLQPPVKPRHLKDWQWHPLADIGWIMSICQQDVDADGDQDVLFSDRTGAERGIWWLENPGVDDAVHSSWEKHAVAGLDREVMFLDVGDVDRDGLEDIVCAVRGGDLVFAKRLMSGTLRWQEESIPMPLGVGTGKAVALGDLQGDEVVDVVVSCENARGAIGLFRLQKPEGGRWIAHDISGDQEGVKFDRIELLDLDGDTDLDVVTCEEADNLGVIWYENPGSE
jgi:hypothetical protein